MYPIGPLPKWIVGRNPKIRHLVVPWTLYSCASLFLNFWQCDWLKLVLKFGYLHLEFISDFPKLIFGVTHHNSYLPNFCLGLWIIWDMNFLNCLKDVFNYCLKFCASHLYLLFLLQRLCLLLAHIYIFYFTLTKDQKGTMLPDLQFIRDPLMQCIKGCEWHCNHIDSKILHPFECGAVILVIYSQRSFW